VNSSTHAERLAKADDLDLPSVVPFQEWRAHGRRPEGAFDPVLTEIARDVRAKVAGIGKGDLFKNVAVARVRVGENGPVKYIAAVNTPGKELAGLGNGFHSEMFLLGQVEGNNPDRVAYILEALYTERAPCLSCAESLGPPFSEVPIFHSVPMQTPQTGLQRAAELADHYKVPPP
jgi:hypothetical protein